MSARLRLHLAWALVVTGLILYLPANLLPVMTITITGAVEPLTVMGGVRELYNTGLVPVAGIVFLASGVLPVVKLLIMAWMLALHGSERSRRARMAMQAFLLKIGTWAMIDIFLLSILTAVGQLGILASVRAEPGALFYSALLVCSILAVDIYKPYMIWQDSPKKAQ